MRSQVPSPHLLSSEGTGPLTGNVGWAQQISRHVTAAGSISRGPAPARWSYPIGIRRAGTSRAAELCALDRCGQSVRYDKTILVGNGHTSALRRQLAGRTVYTCRCVSVAGWPAASGERGPTAVTGGAASLIKR